MEKLKKQEDVKFKAKYQKKMLQKEKQFELREKRVREAEDMIKATPKPHSTIVPVPVPIPVKPMKPAFPLSFIHKMARGEAPYPKVVKIQPNTVKYGPPMFTGNSNAVMNNGGMGCQRGMMGGMNRMGMMAQTEADCDTDRYVIDDPNKDPAETSLTPDKSTDTGCWSCTKEDEQKLFGNTKDKKK